MARLSDFETRRDVPASAPHCQSADLQWPDFRQNHLAKLAYAKIKAIYKKPDETEKLLIFFSISNNIIY